MKPYGAGQREVSPVGRRLRAADNHGDFRLVVWGRLTAADEGALTCRKSSGVLKGARLRTALLSGSAVLLNYFFYNAFRHAPESPQSGSMLVHPTEELPALGIDEGD